MKTACLTKTACKLPKLLISLICLFQIIFIVNTQSVHAAEVTLAWDSNTEANIAGYKIYYGTQSEDYNTDPAGSVNSPATTFTVTGLQEETIYYFAVTAFDTDGNESNFSNEVSYEVPAAGDADNDGIPDEVDECPNDPDNDVDNDGICGDVDNCPSDYNPEQTDTDNDGTGHACDDCPWDPNKTEPGTCGCGVADTDSDNDGTPDCNDTCPSDPNKTEPGTCGCGVADTDSDNDGTPDCNDDNTSPDTPVILSPDNNDSNVSLPPVLSTDDFNDYDNDQHLQSQWQISTSSDFTTFVIDLTTSVHLTSLALPDLVLTGDTTYYQRVKFFDNRNSESDWSETYSFTTEAQDDENQNGIPDSQETDDTTDLDNDGTPDNEQEGIKSILTITGNTAIALKAGSNVSSINSIKTAAHESISDEHNKPSDMPYGVLAFNISVTNPGDTAIVSIYFTDALPDDIKWYKYDSISGWADYSQHAIFASDRKSVALELQDGGFGDSDKTINGIITDPSGIAVTTVSSSTTTTMPVDDNSDDSSSSGGGGGGGGSTSPAIDASAADDPAQDEPVECYTDNDCDNGIFCDGTEYCSAGTCINPTEPCLADEICDEDSETCFTPEPELECETDVDCDDGVFCNGEETCAGGECISENPVCDDDETCDENNDECIASDRVIKQAKPVFSKIRKPVFSTKSYQWLILKYDGTIDFKDPNTTVKIEGSDGTFHGIEIDKAKNPFQYSSTLTIIPVCIYNNATEGEWAVIIRTLDSYGQETIIEAQLVVSSVGPKIFQQG